MYIKKNKLCNFVIV